MKSPFTHQFGLSVETADCYNQQAQINIPAIISLLKGLAAGLISPSALSAEQMKMAEEEQDKAQGTVPRRHVKRFGTKLSIIGFGGIIVMNETPEDSANFVAKAFDQGINYFDVAPTYGNAEERLGPALAPYRDRCFLACKTHERSRAKAEAELNQSLKRMQTDHFDLYQLHAITTVEEVEKIFAPNGVMDMIKKARDDGKIRYLGFSAHSEEAAHMAMDKFDFDSILFPFNFAAWKSENFGPAVHKRASERGMALLALKAMANHRFPNGKRPEGNQWIKAWYEPLDELEKISLGLRFTLGLPTDAAIPPGHWPLFQMAVELASKGALEPLGDKDQPQLEAMITAAQPPIFPS